MSDARNLYQRLIIDDNCNAWMPSRSTVGRADSADQTNSSGFEEAVATVNLNAATVDSS